MGLSELTALPSAVLRDPTPAYYRIFQTLRQRIASGIYAVAEQLPTEDELTREFGVSRHTIRAAVQQLVVQGLVRRQAGKGTFVLDPSNEGGAWAAQSLEDMVDRNFGNIIEAPAMRLLAPGSAEEAMARRHLVTGEAVARFTWVRQSEAGPCASSTVYMPQSCARPLPEDWAARLGETRLLHLVEQFGGLKAFRVRQRSSAISADEKAARLLDVVVGTPLLSLERSYFDREGRVIEHSRILGRPDRCEQTVELFRVGR
jgi:GntR family transcriptional regulator